MGSYEFNTMLYNELWDIHLEEKLEKELAGILNWALEGLLRLVNNDYRFTESKAVNDIMEEYSKTINPYIVFWQEEVIVHTESDNVRMKRKEFYVKNLSIKGHINRLDIDKAEINRLENEFAPEFEEDVMNGKETFREQVFDNPYHAQKLIDAYLDKVVVRDEVVEVYLNVI